LGELGHCDDLDAWVLATAPRAVAYAASLLRDRSLAEDVVQDCYCRLLQKADVYDLPRDGGKLLFRAITNACINHNTRAHPVLSLDGFRDREDGMGWEVADRHTQEPAQVMVGRELRQAIAEGLAQLPVLHRAALELKSLGHSQQEIAQMLNVSPSHAGVLVHRARKSLAVYLAPFIGEAAS
jgi:RNA polymerase sigma-70 factor (ECF subfamily)